MLVLPPASVPTMNTANIEEAKRLLLNPHYTVEEIAEELGYSTPKAFEEAFKKATGEFPQDYRNRLLPTGLD